MADGYISDVPSRVSGADSDISNDLIQSTQALEKNFKDRYKVLKSTYESRLKQLTGVISEACSHIVDDEIVREMKSDSTSVAFLPAHICEIVETFLNSERESLVRQLIAKNTVLEGDLKKSKALNSELRERFSSMEVEVSKGRRAELQVTALQSRTTVLQREFEELSKQAETDVGNLEAEKKALEAEVDEAHRNLESVMEQLSSKTAQFEELRNATDEKDKDLRSLEESFEQSARELAIMEEVEKRDRQQYDSLKFQFESVTKDFADITNHCNELKLKLQASYDEIARNKIIFDKLAQEEDSVKGHISHLMTTVEQLLADEAKESNETLVIMHRKMKSAKEKFNIELNKEKRMLKGVQDEVVALRSTRDDQHRQITHLHEQCSEFRDKLNRENERYNSSQITVQESNRQITDLRVKIKDLELNERVLLEKLRDIDKIKETELRLYGEKVKIECEKNLENEKFHLEKRSQAYRMHYENELSVVQQNVRNSFSRDHSSYQQMSLGQQHQNHHQNHDSSDVAMSIDVAIRAAKESWMAEKARLESDYSTKLSRIQVDVGRQYLQRLQEADETIEKLKNMVKEKQQLLNNQSESIESMRREMALVEKSSATGANNKKHALSYSSPTKAHRYGDNKALNSVGTSSDWDADTGDDNNHHNRDNGGDRRSASVAFKTSDGSGRQSTSSSSNITNSNSSSNNNNNDSSSSVTSSGGNKIDASQLSRLLQDHGVLKEQNQEQETRIQALERENQLLSEDLDALRDQAIQDTETLAGLHKKYQALLLAREKEKINLNGSINSMNKSSSDMVQSTFSDRAILNASLNLNDSLDDNNNNKKYNGNNESDRRNSISDSSSDGEGGGDYRRRDDAATTRGLDSSKFNTAASTIIHHNSNTSQSSSSMARVASSQIAVEYRRDGSDIAAISELEGKVLQQEREIKKLENQYILQKDLLEAAQAEVVTEKGKHSELSRQLAKTNSILFTIDQQYRTQLTQMKVLLSKLRGDVEQVRPSIQLETDRTMGSIHRVMEQVFAKVNATLNSRLSKLSRVDLTSVHSSEMKILEEKYIKKYNELSQHYKEAMESSKKDIMTKTESALSSHKSLSNLPAYESTCNGILEGLMHNGVVTSEQYTYVIDLAKKHAEPSYSATSMSKSLISECILKLHKQHHDDIDAIENECNLVKEENAFLREQQVASSSSNNKEDWNADDSYSSISGSEMNAKGALNNSNISNNSNYNNNHNNSNVSQQDRILAELSNIESESRLRALQDEIDEVKSYHAIELQRMQTDRGEIESQLRKTLEEELVSLRASEKSKQVALEAELREERNKRLRLQTSLSAVESDFESTVENLEKENEALLAKLNSLGS